MTFQPDNFTVWTEIPVTDMDKAIAFYSAVTQSELRIDTSGPNPMANFNPDRMEAGVQGHLYPGKPAAPGTGPTIHLATPGKLEDTMERVTEAGGKVVSPAIQIPPGRFAYIEDPDGNSIGIFELA